MELISVVVPCFNEQEVLLYFYKELCQACETLRASGAESEIWFVDDGSSDGTLRLIRALAKEDKRVRYLSFSRNFGKESAIYAGMKAARGDYVALMDADLQDPPRLLPVMYEELRRTGTEIAAARRLGREGEPRFRSVLSSLFYRLLAHVTSLKLPDGARDYRLMKRPAVDAVLMLPEYHRFSKGIFGWIGFETVWIEYENEHRAAGETKWSLVQLFQYSLEGITGFTTKPLMLSSWLGLFMCGLSAAAIPFVIIRQLLFGGSAFGWPSLVCIITMFSGVQLFCMGILGQYMARTYLEVKKRPLYIIRERDGKENEEPETI